MNALILLIALWLSSTAVHAQWSDDLDSPRREAAAHALQTGALLPYGAQASLAGYRGVLSLDTAYDGVREGALQRVQGEVVVLERRVRLSLLGGGQYGAPDPSVEPRTAGHGGVRLQALEQARHAVDLSAAVSYRSLGFSQLPTLLSELVLGRRLGRLTLLLNAAYGQSTREGDRSGSLGASAIVRALESFYVGADSKVSTDLERDQAEPEFEPQLETRACGFLGYAAPYLSVQLRAGLRTLQYRLQTERLRGPELGVAVATAF